MSYKIYNGYTLELKTTKQLDAFVSRLRKAALRAMHKLAAELVAEQIEQIVDFKIIRDQQFTFLERDIHSDDPQRLVMLAKRMMIDTKLAQLFKEATKETASIQARTELGKYIAKSNEMKQLLSEPTLHENHPIVSRALSSVREKASLASKSNFRDPLYDLEFSLYVWFNVDGKILVRTQCEQEEYIKLFESMPAVKEYRYYTSTDRPRKFTQKEWDKRGRMWDKAYKSMAISVPIIKADIFYPGQDPSFGLSFESVFQLIVSNLKSSKKRADAVAKSVLRDRWIHENYENLTASNAIEAIENSQKWLEKEGQDKLAELTAEYEKKLPELTPEFISRSLKDALQEAAHG